MKFITIPPSNDKYSRVKNVFLNAAFKCLSGVKITKMCNETINFVTYNMPCGIS